MRLQGATGTASGRVPRGVQAHESPRLAVSGAAGALGAGGGPIMPGGHAHAGLQLHAGVLGSGAGGAPAVAAGQETRGHGQVKPL